jgi:hypothetical protein
MPWKVYNKSEKYFQYTTEMVLRFLIYKKLSQSRKTRMNCSIETRQSIEGDISKNREAIG